jgi:hypothetical protein
VATVPLHAPDAVHAVAFVDDQSSFELPPVVIAVGLAVKVIVGVGTTVTDALC